MSDFDQPSISDMFGWTCSSVWRKFALEKGGVFEKGSIIKEQSIKIENQNGTIIYKAFRRANDKSGINTQITASYNTQNDFVFKVRRKWDIYTPVAYLNKLKSIKIDNDIFNKYIIRTNNREKFDKVFQDKEIDELIKLENLFCLEIRKGNKPNEKILYMEINGVIDDYEEIKRTFNLINKILINLF
ncbi:hypothetical protein [Clostridium hydrogenum]|uniref:hypothetical protein n=1 Tax=Clostridium hydrogenum TaxID=2855764 RepID=UPI001F224F5E|nr:hypothetical protein [Clostridium hydrogenum]